MDREKEIYQMALIVANELMRNQERLKELLSEPTSIGNSIRRIAERILGESDKNIINQAADRLDVWWRRIEELESVIQKCIDAMKGSNCLEKQWLEQALKGK